MTCLVTLFDRKLKVFKNSPTIFGIFDELLPIQNVNVNFARNVERETFFCDFLTPWCCKITYDKDNW